MSKKNINIDYKKLVGYMLPKDTLDFFEITKFEEEVTDEQDETCIFR